MADAPASDTLARQLCDWHEGEPAEIQVRPGDPVSARQWLQAALVDDSELAALRLRATELSDGVEWSRLGEHEALGHLGAALEQGRLLAGQVAPPELMRLVPVIPPAPPPPPPAPAPSARASPAAPAPAPAPAEPAVDVAAQVAALIQAAQDGVPFCAECMAAAAAAAAAEEDEPATPLSELPAAEVEAYEVLMGWIEIQLLDSADRPVAGERCLIVAADGSSQEQFTDEHGLVRLEGIAPGRCRVSWPDRDKDAVEEVTA